MDSPKDVGFVNPLYGHINEKPKSRIDILFIFIVIISTTFIVWASFAQIDELARGDGKVIPSSKIQRIQNLDGGIVSEILVKTGQHVKINDPLLKIDTTRFRASFEESQEESLALQAKKARLEMELKLDPRKKTPKLIFPDDVVAYGEQYFDNEISVFKNRVNEYKSSLKILELQFAQKLQEQEEIKSRVKQLTGNLKLVEKQKDTIEKLVKSNAKSKVDLLDIEKEHNQLKGDLDAAKLSIPRSKLAIEESEAKISERVQQFKKEASSELQKVISEIKKIEARLVSDTDKLEKTIVRTPVDGIIKQININTIGGVVKSGVDLMEIVPDSDILLIEAKIDPKDIAFINPQQKTVVKITAYDYTIYGGLEGKIIEISADSIKDEDSKDGKSYYKVIVETKKNYLEKDGEKLSIIPGMIASVDIVTGKKSIMDFLLKPILKVKEGSLHER